MADISKTIQLTPKLSRLINSTTGKRKQVFFYFAVNCPFNNTSILLNILIITQALDIETSSTGLYYISSERCHSILPVITPVELALLLLFTCQQNGVVRYTVTTLFPDQSAD